MVDQNTALSISQVARRSGYAASALRYYEELGLIVADRAPSGRRQYPRSVLRRLAFIRAAQNVGLPLAQIQQQLATLPVDRSPTKADWTQIAQSWQALLAERIVALQELAGTLDSCIGCGCLSLESCQLYNTGDALADQPGLPGAKRWSPVLRAEPVSGRPGR